jgi:hypothetical protein
MVDARALNPSKHLPPEHVYVSLYDGAPYIHPLCPTIYAEQTHAAFAMRDLSTPLPRSTLTLWTTFLGRGSLPVLISQLRWETHMRVFGR